MNAKPNEHMADDVVCDWNWAGEHEPAALAFIRNHLFDRWCRDSTMPEDTKQSTDYVIKSPQNVTIAMRVRRISNTRAKRDFTLRLRRRSGAKTEVAKIASGYADIYCYCWVDDNSGGMIDEYVIVDLSKFRSANLLDNPDGTMWTNDGSSQFAYWSLHTLQDADVILEGVKHPGAAVSYHMTTPPDRSQ